MGGKKKKIATRSYESQAYWDARYVQRISDRTIKASTKTASKKRAARADDDVDDITDEWYFSYDILQPLFEHHIRNINVLKNPDKVVLDVGCGLSQLFSDLRADNWQSQLIGIDYSPTLIKHLHQLFPPSKISKHTFQFLEMDAMKMSFADQSVHVVIDKATTDGLMASSESADTTPLMYAEVSRILAPGGVYIIATVNQPSWLSDFVLDNLLKASPASRWRIGVHSFSSSEKDAKVYILEKLDLNRLRASTLAQAERFTVTSYSH